MARARLSMSCSGVVAGERARFRPYYIRVRGVVSGQRCRRRSRQRGRKSSRGRMISQSYLRVGVVQLVMLKDTNQRGDYQRVTARRAPATPPKKTSPKLGRAGRAKPRLTIRDFPPLASLDRLSQPLIPIVSNFVSTGFRLGRADYLDELGFVGEDEGLAQFVFGDDALVGRFEPAFKVRAVDPLRENEAGKVRSSAPPRGYRGQPRKLRV